jgi:hypothetical protein
MKKYKVSNSELGYEQIIMAENKPTSEEFKGAQYQD